MHACTTRQFEPLIIISHTGQDTSLDVTDGVTHAVVLKLADGLEHRGHHLYCDNYYTSPTLFCSLRRLGFGACGTARSNQKRMPVVVTEA